MGRNPTLTEENVMQNDETKAYVGTYEDKIAVFAGNVHSEYFGSVQTFHPATGENWQSVEQATNWAKEFYNFN